MTDGPSSRAFTFIGGGVGAWSVVSQRTIAGPPIADVARVDAVSGFATATPVGAAWMLHGVTTNDRYTTSEEKAELIERQAPIGRPEATRAARGFLKAVIGKDDRILGFTMIGPEAGEVMTVVQLAMMGGMPYTALKNGVIAHPTMAEGLNVLFSSYRYYNTRLDMLDGTPASRVSAHDLEKLVCERLSMQLTD